MAAESHAADLGVGNPDGTRSSKLSFSIAVRLIWKLHVEVSKVDVLPVDEVCSSIMMVVVQGRGASELKPLMVRSTKVDVKVDGQSCGKLSETGMQQRSTRLHTSWHETASATGDEYKIRYKKGKRQDDFESIE